MQLDWYEIAYAEALHCIASGLTRSETFAAITDGRSITDSDVREATKDALKDALRQGVEREDIDPSWF